MKSWKIVCMMALALVMLFALPALASEVTETAPDPVNCEEGGEHEFAPETVWDVTKPATCTEVGSQQAVCSKCEKLVVREIPTTEHTFTVLVSEEVPATCTTTGTTAVFKCAYCDETTGGETIPVDPNAHVWDDGEVTKKPTCTKEGERTYTCTLCQTTRTEAVAAAGHKWGSWVTTKEATEDEDGVQTRTCSVCGDTQTRTVKYDGTMPETGVFTLPTARLAGVLALSVTGYVALKRKAVRG